MATTTMPSELPANPSPNDYNTTIPATNYSSSDNQTQPDTSTAATAPYHVADLSRLTGRGPETIDCPSCGQRAQITVQGRSEGKKKFMNVFWWPMPDRKHWWEETRWHCGHCEVQVASQKHGKNVQVLV